MDHEAICGLIYYINEIPESPDFTRALQSGFSAVHIHPPKLTLVPVAKGVGFCYDFQHVPKNLPRVIFNNHLFLIN